MARIQLNFEPYPDVPSAIPSGAPANDYQHIQASPAAFGAPQAQGLQTLGQGIERTAEAGFQVQQFHDRVAADQEMNNFIEARTKLEYGDPKTGSTGYFGTYGSGALSSRQPTVDALNQARQSSLDRLQSPNSKLLFDTESRRMFSDSQMRISRHADDQQKIWAQGVNASGADLNLNGYANSVLSHPNEAQGYADRYIDAQVKNSQLKFGNDPQITKDTIAKANQALLETQLNAVAVHSPAAALKMLEDNKSTAGIRYDDIYNRLRAKGEAQSGAQIAGQAIASVRSGTFSPTVNNAITSAATSAGVNPVTMTRFAQIESGGKPDASTGSYHGLFQLSNEEFRKYGPPGGDIYNPRDNAAAAANKMKIEGQVFADKFGHQPTPFDSYMIHQQGLGGYAAHLSRPDAPAWMNMASTAEGQQKGQGWAKAAVWGNIPDQYKAAFGSVNNVTSRDFLNMWQQKFGQGGSAVGLPQVGATTPVASQLRPQFSFPAEETLYGGQGRGAYDTGTFTPPNIAATIRPNVVQAILDNPEAQQNPEIMRHALSNAAMVLNAQEIAENENTKAKNSLNDVAANEHVTAIADALHTPGSDLVSLYGRIAHDDRLKWETKERLLDRTAKASGEEERISYGPGFLDAYKRILTAAGTPGHIGKVDDILNLPIDAVTMHGQKELLNTLKLTTKEDSAAAGEAEMKKVFLDSARRIVSGEGILPGMKDPKGEEIFLRFLGYFFPAYDKARADGKNPQELLNPDSKDYLGKSLDVMKRPQTEWFKDIATSGTTAGPITLATPKFNPDNIKAPDQLKSALNTGAIDYATAVRLGLERGWIRENPLAPPPAAAPVAPQVPISR